jgi:hypothetical protein
MARIGLFYDRDVEAKEWRLTGSREGLLSFSRLLADYSAQPSNDSPSEHDHFGPHMYLEVMTWDKPNITSHAIAGTLADIRRLASIVEKGLGQVQSGLFVIREEYAPGAEYAIVLDVREDGFDPATLDPQL